MTDKESDRDGNATVIIKGSMHDANEAKRTILDLVSSNSNRYSDRERNDSSRNYESRSQNSRGFEPRNDGPREYESRSNDHKDTIEIYPDKVGSVIGRRGATINDIQDKFKVKVNIDKNSNSNGKATVSVSGNRSDVSKAIDNIKELVGDTRSYESQSNNYQQQNSSGSYNQQNSYGSRQQQNSYGNQQNNHAPEPMEYEQIDWQAAARESVSFYLKKKSKKKKNI